MGAGDRARSPQVRSLLDPNRPPPVPGTRLSPPAGNADRQRTRSDAAAYPPVSSRDPAARRPSNPGIMEDSYQFEMLPSIDNQAAPKRVSQGGKQRWGRMGGFFGGGEPSSRDLGGRHNSTAGVLGRNQQHSPSRRSTSPGLNRNNLNLMPNPNQYVTDTGKVIDLKSAYRRLSDAAVLRSGGTLSSTLPIRKGSDPAKGEMVSPDGGVRLTRDYFEGEEDDDDDAVTSSDSETGAESSGGEGLRGRRSRGRTRQKQTAPAKKVPVDPRQPRSLLAAAEEERKKQESQLRNTSPSYKVRSLLEPTVTVTAPDGKPTKLRRSSQVHPQSSFDAATASGLTSPVDSEEDEDLRDIEKATKLNIRQSPITSTAASHRSMCTIIRGAFIRMQQEAERGYRRQRVYLVATDMSEEAQHALEWTIGTVLRDGDTLLAVDAVESDLVDPARSEKGISIGKGADAAAEANTIARTFTNQNMGLMPVGQFLDDAEPPNKASMSKSEIERWHLVRQISNRCIKLLRRTKLQVRIVVEVFHCESPKHIITEIVRLCSNLPLDPGRPFSNPQHIQRTTRVMLTVFHRSTFSTRPLSSSAAADGAPSKAFCSVLSPTTSSTRALSPSWWRERG